jgi:hypothetical protein
VGTAKEEIYKLTKEGVLIFGGGTNDVTWNVSGKKLIQIIKFFMRNQHIKIILKNAPRHWNGKPE